MNNITWLDLYNFLYSKAHDLNKLGDFEWNSPVIIHDASTGEEYDCDTYLIDNKLTLTINMESVFNERN
jgi:hypothetical protein